MVGERWAKDADEVKMEVLRLFDEECFSQPLSQGVTFRTIYAYTNTTLITLFSLEEIKGALDLHISIGQKHVITFLLYCFLLVDAQDK